MNKATGKLKAAKAAMMRRPVTVIVTIVSDNPKQFEIDSSGLPIKKQSGKEPVLTFDNHAGGHYEDGFTVSFALVDKTGKGYLFFQDPAGPDPNDAMSVKLVDQKGYCPRRGQKWDGFKPTSVTNGRKTLVVDNANNHMQYFGFALHFSFSDDKRPRLTYDPIGDNRNGGLGPITGDHR